jgi:hypothetical protein
MVTRMVTFQAVVKTGAWEGSGQFGRAGKRRSE